MKSSIVSGENRGSINNILLKALQSGDKYGYEINKEIETKSNGRYFLKEASLYSGLKRLEANGFITSYWKDGELGIRRHYYSITSKGIEKINNSNFTWDTSKDFIDDMFQNPIVAQNSNNNQIDNKSINTAENTDTLANTDNSSEGTSKNQLETIKKNPFQYEVSPMQQSLFDTTLFDVNTKNENNESTFGNKENLSNNASSLESTEKEKNDNSTESLTIESEIKCLNDNIQQKNEQNLEKSPLVEKADDKSTSIEKSVETPPTYDDLIKNYAQNNYSSNLEKDNNKLDLSPLFDKEKKENEESIIINKHEESKASSMFNFEKNIEKTNKDILINNGNKEKVANEKIQTENIIKEEKSKIDLHNIFGNVLVNNEENNIEEPLEFAKENNDNEIEKEVKQKKELPRIILKDDVNISLNAPKQIVNDEIVLEKQTKSFNEKYNQNSYYNLSEKNNNSPSVKQYLHTVRQKSNTTSNIDDAISLEGINVRQYSKMNNRLIKNSNYIYINRLNLFLTILFTALILIECSIALTALCIQNKINAFEIIFYSFCAVLMLVYLAYSINQYNKDKFKVILKKYSLKNNMFYATTLFVVSFIIFVCINIFQGMNSNNFSDFVLKLLLELLICINVVIYPIIKNFCYKIKRFSN